MNFALKSLIKTSAAGVALALAAGLAQAESPAVAPETEKLTRKQVVAEAIEARRLGLIPYGDQSAPIATPEQLDRIRMAGLRALSTTASR